MSWNVTMTSGCSRVRMALVLLWSFFASYCLAESLLDLGAPPPPPYSSAACNNIFTTEIPNCTGSDFTNGCSAMCTNSITAIFKSLTLECVGSWVESAFGSEASSTAVIYLCRAGILDSSTTADPDTGASKTTKAMDGATGIQTQRTLISTTSVQSKFSSFAEGTSLPQSSIMPGLSPPVVPQLATEPSLSIPPLPTFPAVPAVPAIPTVLTAPNVPMISTASTASTVSAVLPAPVASSISTAPMAPPVPTDSIFSSFPTSSFLTRAPSPNPIMTDTPPMLSIIATTVTTQPPSSTVQPANSTSAGDAGGLMTSQKLQIGPIVGGVLGGCAIIAIVSSTVFYFLLRRLRRTRCSRPPSYSSWSALDPEMALRQRSFASPHSNNVNTYFLDAPPPAMRPIRSNSSRSSRSGVSALARNDSMSNRSLYRNDSIISRYDQLDVPSAAFREAEWSRLRGQSSLLRQPSAARQTFRNPSTIIEEVDDSEPSVYELPADSTSVRGELRDPGG